MAEHIVARVLRERAANIRACMPLVEKPDETIQLVQSWVASQFEHMAEEVGRLDLERGASTPMGRAGRELSDALGPIALADLRGPERFDPRKLGPDLPEGAHPDSPGEAYRPIRIRRPVGVSQAGGTVVAYGGPGMAGTAGMGGGGGGSSSFQPSISISPQRVEAAAKSAYTAMSEAALVAEGRPSMLLGWDHLDERDRHNWRLAIGDALRAALEDDRA